MSEYYKASISSISCDLLIFLVINFVFLLSGVIYVFYLRTKWICSALPYDLSFAARALLIAIPWSVGSNIVHCLSVSVCVCLRICLSGIVCLSIQTIFTRPIDSPSSVALPVFFNLSVCVSVWCMCLYCLSICLPVCLMVVWLPDWLAGFYISKRRFIVLWCKWKPQIQFSSGSVRVSNKAVDRWARNE